MFYVFTHTMIATDLVAAPARIEMPLTVGVIHQVDVLFETGCNNDACVQIFRGGQQLWPSNRGAYMVGNATIVSFREFEELKAGANDLYALIWGAVALVGPQVSIQIGILPKTILQPMSFNALLAAATGM